jgi:hypothetical protein
MAPVRFLPSPWERFGMIRKPALMWPPVLLGVNLHVHSKKEADMAVDVRAMGKAGLTGWRGKMASKVADPVSDHTRLKRVDVEALIGWAFLALAVLQFARVVRSTVRAGREASSA